jgi:hypothetical protein
MLWVAGPFHTINQDGIRIAASEIVPEGRFVASFKMLPLAVALLEASRSRSALPNAL